MNGVLHHIEINVSDIEKSISFWRWLLTEKFNYIQCRKWEGGIEFKLGSTHIIFVQTDKNYSDSIFNLRKPGLNHLAFRCDSQQFVDSLTRELKERSITILYTDRHPFAGGKNYYAVFFEDPDKIKVEVVVNEIE